MCNYIEWLSKLPQGPKKGDYNVLLGDNFSAHKTKTVKEKANELQIQLLFFPSRMSVYLSPLDNFTFGSFQTAW